MDGNEVTFNIEDADADPTNELQNLTQIDDTTFVISGTNDTITISILSTDDQVISISNDTIYLEDGGFAVLPDLDDHDWYEVGTTTAPDNINDNIWTEGYALIGTNNNAAISDTLNTSLVVDGNILPAIHATYDLGYRTRRWNTIWAVNGIFSLSDRRYKENVTTLEYGLADVMKMNPVSYDWKDKSQINKRQLGLLAQEMFDIIPEIVDTGDASSDVYSIDYVSIVPILIKAIQDQQKIIDEQQAKIEGLEAENEKNEIFKAELQEMKSENSSLMKRLDSIEEFMRHLKQEAKKE